MKKYLQRISEIKRFPKKIFRTEELEKMSATLEIIKNETQQENKKEELQVIPQKVVTQNRVTKKIAKTNRKK